MTDPSPFLSDSIVLLIQMKGAAFRATGNNITWGAWSDRRNAGHYEFLVVEQVIGNTVRFTRNLTRSYHASDFVQLVTVPRFNSATVTATLTASAWNGDTGGILAFLVRDELNLEADIDVSHLGFRGAETVLLDENVCDIGPNEYAFSTSFFKAGNKGEGLATYYTIPPDLTAFPVGNDFARGRGRLINAGAGGNGRYAGGGGGANYANGGFGGRPDEQCGDLGIYQALDSYGLQDFFADAPIGKRLVMGGGGGSGTSGFGRAGGKGGNAGGMVFILAGKINGNNLAILANGETGGSANGGAGGGGAGGTIALHINEYSNSLNIEIKGGAGGNGNSTSGLRTGPGGGGSGGTLLVRQAVLPASINVSRAGGANGTPNLFGAFGGEDGGIYTELEFTLNGFLFHSIGRNQLICELIEPELLTGPGPLGGVPPYSYQWRMSIDGGIIYNNISGAIGFDYQPDDDMAPGIYYFKRRVQDAVGPDQISDEGNPVKIEVVPAIGNNSIFGTPPLTICEGSSPSTFTGSQPNGGAGPGTYFLQWQRRILSGMWEVVPGISDDRDYTSPALIDTTEFRRIVISGVCVDTTGINITINVHPAIDNNIIGSVQTICTNQTPDPLTGSNAPLLEGGDGSYSFLWQVNDGGWQPAPGANTGQNYTFPSDLTANTSYRRRVISGECEDFSGDLQITVLPLISGNIIGSDTTLCEGTQRVLPLGGGPLNGGAGPGTYNFSWETSTDGINFIPAAGGNLASFASGVIHQETYFHRIVTSGPCEDVSNEVTISVDDWPEIVPESVFPTPDTLFFIFEATLEAATPIRGAGTWSVEKGTGILNSPNSEITTVRNLSRLDNDFKWTVNYLNCFVDTLINIFVTDLFRPNAFSPNGDGRYDYLEFLGLEYSESNELTIFNRQGNIVFRARNYQVDSSQDLWDGRDLSGNPVMDDTYYYVLLVNNRFKYQGFIILKR